MIHIRYRDGELDILTEEDMHNENSFIIIHPSDRDDIPRGGGTDG